MTEPYIAEGEVLQCPGCLAQIAKAKRDIFRHEQANAFDFEFFGKEQFNGDNAACEVCGTVYLDSSYRPFINGEWRT